MEASLREKPLANRLFFAVNGPMRKKSTAKGKTKPSRAAKAKKSLALIFVVDDEPMMGEVVEAILQLEGHQTRVFTEPEEALRAIESEKGNLQLLLTDFVMPGMNGMELIEQAKKVAPELRTILFSGNFGQDIMRYYPVKPDRFLNKPFQPKALTGLVKAVLAK
jgi:DNA-binding NtrC family response regulator